MPNVDINTWAVIVAALISMIVGSFWYSKSLFGKEWAKLVGRKLEDMSGGGKGYAVAAAGALIQAYILAHFVQYTGSTSLWDGLATGFWLWLGFVAVVVAINLAFEGRNWALWKINAGYFLVVLLINGGLLAAWR
ncbi:DUF1761 domain-containing protein [Candidatus Saccharibacteria bacterium]|nr:DUF1761 domain-containing protein [Candidatus Saccharibacteria bacterium]